jgi:hypothetical protein
VVIDLCLIYDTISEKTAQNDQIKLSLLSRIVNKINIHKAAVVVALRTGLRPMAKENTRLTANGEGRKG